MKKDTQSIKCLRVHPVRLEHERTYHATGNVNIQSAWEHGELAKEYFANPSTFGQTLERELILDVYQLWRYQQFVDVAFERRSPGNTSIITKVFTGAVPEKY